jgi:hypothetical protein
MRSIARLGRYFGSRCGGGGGSNGAAGGQRIPPVLLRSRVGMTRVVGWAVRGFEIEIVCGSMAVESHVSQKTRDMGTPFEGCRLTADSSCRASLARRNDMGLVARDHDVTEVPSLAVTSAI